MKKIFLIILILMFSVGVVHAEVITFSDNVVHWPGWTNGNDDATDHIGDIDFYGGDIIIDRGYLDKITFRYMNGNATLMPMDLFLDTDHDHVWDYVVKLYLGKNTSHNYLLPGYYDIYHISVPKNAKDVYVTAWLTPDPSTHREGHPVALKEYPSSSIGQAYFSGWQADPLGNSLESYFDFPSRLIALDLDEGFILSWTVQCANDVIYYDYPGTHTLSHAPEPSTLLLVSLGFLGLEFWRRRRKDKE